MAKRKKQHKTVERDGKKVKLTRFEGDSNWVVDKE